MSAHPPAPDPREWAVQPRARGPGVPLFVTIGKDYGRNVHQAVPLGIVLDEAKLCLEMRRANPASEEPTRNPVYKDYYLPLRQRVGPDLDDKLLSDRNWSFRTKAAAEVHKGRSQGRSDDIVCLRRILPEHHLFKHLPADHARGFPTDEYARLLRTPDLELDDLEIRTALNASIIDAPSDQLYAGLFAGYTLPSDNVHPLEGLFRSDLFVDAYLGIFFGPRAAKHLTPGSGGRRSKAYKNNMTMVSKGSIAYVAMLLRFCLHQAETWYTVESNLDTRYNYLIFYTEILAILNEPEFKPQVDNLLAYLNALIFPNVHRRPANAPYNNGQGALERALARLRVHAAQGNA
ncbi:hypothetical protein CTheo_8080 [Ceratobasidium theobromae]|uniref:Uncharacterized protein n=1 Tax=Ceratobasidium theobromae TaxID=1582974 RepID=A0A5N5QAP6_9AGAM|nr:hypothetical protein CTheo_8080 [Ceratobasidium theobromae]